jgi:DNA polymerase-3 subunit epsilon
VITVDIETTGLLRPETKEPEHQPGIVQIALARLEKVSSEHFVGFTVARKQVWLVNPEKPVWEPDAIKVHGITPDKVADAPTLFAIYPELCEWFLGADKWVGFNNEFDRKVLFYALARLSLEGRFPWPPDDIDIMKIAKPILNIAGKRDIKHPNLTECHQQLTGEGFDGAHDALADVLATVRCLNRLVSEGYIW